MENQLPRYLACALLAAALALSGCSKKPSDVLARVGDEEITVADFKAEIEWRQANHQPLPDRQTLLDQMVDRESMLQQARAAGVQNAPAVRRACEDILLARFQETRLAPKIAQAKVTPAEVKAAYEQDLARFTQPAKAKLAFVVVAVGAKADTNQVAAAEARAQEALVKAGALPAEARGFGMVAADYSDDQVTRYRGGDAGWFAADGLEVVWPKEIVAAGFALKNPGDLSGVLRGREGFYLVKKLDSRPATVTPLEQVHASIERRLLMAKQQDLERQLKSQARDAATISTDTNLLKTLGYPDPNTARNTAPRIPVAPTAPL